MSLNVLQMICSIISFSGCLFIIKKNIIGQYLWAVSNVGWMYWSWAQGFYFQFALWTAYLFVTLISIYEWSKDIKKECCCEA